MGKFKRTSAGQFGAIACAVIVGVHPACTAGRRFFVPHLSFDRVVWSAGYDRRLEFGAIGRRNSVRGAGHWNRRPVVEVAGTVSGARAATRRDEIAAKPAARPFGQNPGVLDCCAHQIWNRDDNYRLATWPPSDQLGLVVSGLHAGSICDWSQNHRAYLGFAPTPDSQCLCARCG